MEIVARRCSSRLDYAGRVDDLPVTKIGHKQQNLAVEAVRKTYIIHEQYIIIIYIKCSKVKLLACKVLVKQ